MPFSNEIFGRVVQELRVRRLQRVWSLIQQLSTAELSTTELSVCEAPFTRYNRLSSRYDNRLYRVYKHSTGCQTRLTTGLTIIVNSGARRRTHCMDARASTVETKPRKELASHRYFNKRQCGCKSKLSKHTKYMFNLTHTFLSPAILVVIH